MKNLVGVVLSAVLLILFVVPKVTSQDELEAELAVARSNCEVTYVCCRLQVKKRRFRFRRRLPWRSRARCLRWCPQGNTCPEIPTPFEAYDVDEVAEEDNPNEFLHGASEDNAEVAEVDIEAAEEVPEEEVAEQEDENPDGDDIINIPVDGSVPVGISTASVIKVPCNGNHRPDRYGVCREVF